MPNQKDVNTVAVARKVRALVVQYLQEQVIPNISDDLNDLVQSDDKLQSLMEKPYSVEDIQAMVKNSKQFKAAIDELIVEAVSAVTYMTPGAD